MFWCTVTLILHIILSYLVGIEADVHTPENITITFLNSVSVKISWSMALHNIDKYDITYKPTDASYKVVAVVGANFNSVTLNNLLPNSQYQMSVTAVKSGKKYRSRPIIFRTLESGAVATDAIVGNDNETAASNVITLGTPEIVAGNGNIVTPNSAPYGPSNTPQPYIQGCGRRKRAWDNEPLDILKNVRGIEVTIVVLVLMVWVGAIILFFNRWGKIRMLIPYQPDYKETQLKVPGTGVCSSATTYQNQNGSALCCSQRNVCQNARATCQRDSCDCPFAGSLQNVITQRAQFQSVSCQHMKLASHNLPVRKSKSADYIPYTYNRHHRYRYRILEKIPTVSICEASESNSS